jgi:dCTP deaminase
MFLGGKELEAQLKLSLGAQFRQERIAQVGYELSLGDEIYRTSNKDGVKEDIKDNTQITIEPGQFALLLTNEVIEIPNNLIGFISIKFKLKKKGLVNISGFHVDPGFKGKIKFSVYNAGPTSITLDKGKPYFLIWLSQLTSEATKPYNGSYDGQAHIDDSDVNDLKGEIASPNVLLQRINENKDHLIRLSSLAAILITICATIAINFYFKKNDYEEGYKFRIKEETWARKIDSLTKIKVDSIIKSSNSKKDTTLFPFVFKLK